jgi:hypothetical protein
VHCTNGFSGIWGADIEGHQILHYEDIIPGRRGKRWGIISEKEEDKKTEIKMFPVLQSDNQSIVIY